MYRASLTTDEDRYSGPLQSTASSRRGRRRHYPRRSSATSEAPSSEEEHQDDDDDQELQHGTPSFALSLLGPAIDGEDENPRIFSLPVAAVISLLANYLINIKAVQEVEGVDLGTVTAAIRAAYPEATPEEVLAVAADQAEAIYATQRDERNATS
jgi:hypothetical protein